MERVSRRTFIKLAGAVGGVLLLTPLRSVIAGKDVNWVSVGSMEDFPVGMAVLVEENKRSPVIILRQQDGIRAMSAKCTHAGCTVEIEPDGSYSCPCHGSKFADDGAVKKGPARRDLKTLMVRVSDTGDIQVGL
jgi:Rieske Fe-S protein